MTSADVAFFNRQAWASGIVYFRKRLAKGLNGYFYCIETSRTA
jgi:hypothetical protein